MKFEYTNEIELPKKPPEEVLPYDERQKQVRYRCFTHAYVALIVLVFLNMLLVDSDIPWFDHASGAIICILLSFAAGMIEVIFRDAYLPPRAKPTPVWDIIELLLYFGAAVAWFSVLHSNSQGGIPLIENGMLSQRLLYPVGFVIFGLVDLAVVIKRQINRVADKKQPENED